jgi:hypothetical protein
MALALIERGNARVVAFDFGFTPKSMSKMVPAENSFRSDMAMGSLLLNIRIKLFSDAYIQEFLLHLLKKSDQVHSLLFLRTDFLWNHPRVPGISITLSPPLIQ